MPIQLLMTQAHCMTPPRSKVAAPTQALPPLPDTYEEAFAELELLVRSMDEGRLPLDQLLSQYQRGSQLLKFCRERLQAVEEQIKVVDEQGGVTPWEGA